jgi:hypothetical protein
LALPAADDLVNNGEPDFVVDLRGFASICCDLASLEVVRMAESMTELEMLARLQAAAARVRPLEELTDHIAAGTLRFSDAVIELADADQVSGLAVLIGGRTGVACEALVRDLYAPDVAPLMTACRAALLELESFSAILRMRRRRGVFGAADVGRLLRAYQAVLQQGNLPIPDTK